MSNFTELDKRLQDIAMIDFAYFCYITGADKRQAAICLERADGKTLQQIANKLKIPKSTVRDVCKKCVDNTHKK